MRRVRDAGGWRPGDDGPPDVDVCPKCGTDLEHPRGECPTYGDNGWEVARRGR